MTLGLGLGLGLALGGCASPGDSGPVKPNEYAFWPLFPDEPRVQFIRSFNEIGDVSPRKSSALEDIIYGEEEQSARFLVRKPYGVTMHDERIYVCDIRGPSVVVLDLAKQETRLMGITGSNRVQRPVDVAVASDGMIYVADLPRGVIFVYDENERSAGVFGFQGLEPVGVAVYQDELFVTDFASQQVLVLDRQSGEVLRRIGEPGDEEGKFVRPLGLAIDREGHVYVTDAIAGRVQKFTHEGEFVSSYGAISDQIGAFVRPKHLAVDSEGIIYVVDAASQIVQMFNNQYELLMFFGTSGTHLGSMFLPAGIEVYEGEVEAFDPYVHPGFAVDRYILVTNQFGDNRVSVYALGELREGYTARDLVSVNQAPEIDEQQGQAGQMPELPEGTPEPGAEEPGTEEAGDELEADESREEPSGATPREDDDGPDS